MHHVIAETTQVLGHAVSINAIDGHPQATCIGHNIAVKDELNLLQVCAVGVYVGCRAMHPGFLARPQRYSHPYAQLVFNLDQGPGSFYYCGSSTCIIYRPLCNIVTIIMRTQH